MAPAAYNTTSAGPTTAQRFEAKYIVSEMEAQAFREHIQPFVEPDKHGQEYPVTSIYLDSDNLALYMSSVRGEERRRKLRIRTYVGNDAVCFFEVKHRLNQIVRKERATVRCEHVADLLRGAMPAPEMLVDPDRDMKNLYSFCDTRERIEATPRVVVRYMREAYVAKREEPVRITFDRSVTCLPSTHFDPAAWDASPHWNDGKSSYIVMEVKFSDTYPCWVGDLIQRFDMCRESFAKYVICVDSLREEGFRVSGQMEGFA